MARGKFQTLTEQMFYILLCLRQERCGADVMAWVAEATGSRVAVGPGTLYNLLEQFLQAGYIRETKVEGRKRSYVLTPTGREALEAEARRLRQLTADYERLMESEGGGAFQSSRYCGMPSGQTVKSFCEQWLCLLRRQVCGICQATDYKSSRFSRNSPCRQFCADRP